MEIAQILLKGEGKKKCIKKAAKCMVIAFFPI